MAYSRFWGFTSYLWWVRWPCVSKKSPRLGFPHTHLEPDLCALLSCGFEDRNFLESPFYHLWNGIITPIFNSKTYTHTHSLTSASICESTVWTRNHATKEGYYISVLRHTALGLRRLQHFLNRRIVVSGNAVDSEMARAGVPITGQARAIPEWFRPKNWREAFRRPAQCWLCLMCEFSQSTSSLWALVFYLLNGDDEQCMSCPLHEVAGRVKWDDWCSIAGDRVACSMCCDISQSPQQSARFWKGVTVFSQCL